MNIMPQEIEVWYILPAIRKELAKELLLKKLSQKEVAKKLGLSEAAVSQYLKGKRGCDVSFNKKIIDRIKKATTNIMNKNCLIKEMNEICRLVKKEEILCKTHREHTKMPKKCGACLR